MYECSCNMARPRYPIKDECLRARRTTPFRLEGRRHVEEVAVWYWHLAVALRDEQFIASGVLMGEVHRRPVARRNWKTVHRTQPIKANFKVQSLSVCSCWTFL